MRTPSISARRFLTSGTVAAVLAGGLVAIGLAPASANPQPIAQRTASSVTADALPTAQIDGVVWSQAVVGNIVYAGGSFANARPAGSALGQNQVTRHNLLAYDIGTGNLITSFAPSLNAQAKVVAASPDGTRLYVGGSFTTADGVDHYRLAAYSTATGVLVASFAPVLDAPVNAIVATNTTVYVGGEFSSANNVTRSRLAAFSATDGSLLAWAPSASGGEVHTMVLTPDHTRLIAGGSFTSMNGSTSAYGLASLDPTTAALYSYAATSVVQDAGVNSAILQLTTDGTAIYGNGYVFGSGGDLEGAFSADPDTGTINWVEDCHGDTYGNFPVNGVDYTISHDHYCGNVGGFPQTSPDWTYHHTLAFTAKATGTLLHNTESPDMYTDFGGQPSPTLINWFPDLAVGTYTGQSQAAWSIAGNSTYVVLGGEFPSVNGRNQQGLVRFATAPTAPSKQGPMVSGSDFMPTTLSLSNTSVRVSWQANWDRDDENLTYELVRNGDTNHPIYTTTATSQFWNQPGMGYVDTGLTPGASYDYRLYAADPDGNFVWGDTVTATVPTASPGTYSKSVLADGATSYWRLDEAAGTTATDWAGLNNLSEGSAVTHATAGAILGDTDTADTFGGSSSGYAETTTPAAGPNTFTLEAWIKTSTTNGGKIVGFGDGAGGALSNNYDRQIYMDNAGHLIFGVYKNGDLTASSSGAAGVYNDNHWHQVVATLSSSGMALYVDGALVAGNAATTVGQPFSGYWHVGGDNLGTWPAQPTSNFFGGAIDDVAIYPTALNVGQIGTHYRNSGRTITGSNQSPVAAFTAAPTNMSVTFDGSASADPDGTIASYAWAFGDGATGTGAKPSHTYAAPGAHSVVLTVTDNQGATGQVTHSVTVSAAANKPPVAAFTATPVNLTVSFDGSASADPDGTIASYAWAFGDGATGTGATPSHTYAAGVYSAVLTVTDNQGATGQVTHSVTVSAAANKPPVASFTFAPVNLTVSFDGSASADPDGTIASYAWGFGGGATGTGATASHTYAAVGVYSVVLTVTDNKGATGSVTKSVTVNPAAAFASDTFTRTVAGQWGNANAGGAWTVNGAVNAFAVNGSVGQMTMSAPGAGPTAMLNSVSQANANLMVDSSMSKLATGNGAFLTVLLRHQGSSDYRFKVRYMTGGAIHLVISKVVNNAETTLQEAVIAGLTFHLGDVLGARVVISGNGTTTISGKVWKVGTTEPAAAQMTLTDTQAALQTAGSIGLQSYLSGSSTNAPVVMNIDNLSASLN